MVNFVAFGLAWVIGRWVFPLTKVCSGFGLAAMQITTNYLLNTFKIKNSILEKINGWTQ